jgi:hypothetical protein
MPEDPLSPLNDTRFIMWPEAILLLTVVIVYYILGVLSVQYPRRYAEAGGVNG